MPNEVAYVSVARASHRCTEEGRVICVNDESTEGWELEPSDENPNPNEHHLKDCPLCHEDLPDPSDIVE